MIKFFTFYFCDIVWLDRRRDRISCCFEENIDGDAIRVVTTGTGNFQNIHINGLQTAFTNNTGYAVNVSAEANTGHSGATSPRC